MSTAENSLHFVDPQVSASARVASIVDGDPSSGTVPAGISAAWRKLLMQAQMAAPHVQVASIDGEAGSGKQTLARYLLHCSPISNRHFQRYDAREWLLGDFDPASLSGFIYLDRVDLLSVPGQGLLLNVLKGLQDRSGSAGPSRVLLAASSLAPLRQMAAQRQMVPDLAFRLTAVRFAIPPLRMRKEDIAPIAQAILDRICARYQQRPVLLGTGTLARLLQHNWPGNVRELASMLEAALLEANSDTIMPNDLPLLSANETPIDATQASPTASLNLDDVIHRHVQYVLELNRGNKLRAARQLGISRSTLYRLLGNEQAVA